MFVQSTSFSFGRLDSSAESGSTESFTVSVSGQILSLPSRHMKELDTIRLHLSFLLSRKTSKVSICCVGFELQIPSCDRKPNATSKASIGCVGFELHIPSCDRKPMLKTGSCLPRKKRRSELKDTID